MQDREKLEVTDNMLHEVLAILEEEGVASASSGCPQRCTPYRCNLRHTVGPPARLGRSSSHAMAAPRAHAADHCACMLQLHHVLPLSPCTSHRLFVSGSLEPHSQ